MATNEAKKEIRCAATFFVKDEEDVWIKYG